MTYLTKLMAAATAGAFALAAPVAADTILFSGDLGVTVENGGETFFLDINEDGLNDMEFSVDSNGFAYGTGISNGNREIFSSTVIFGDREGVITKYGEGDTIGRPRDVVALGGPRMVNDTAMLEGFEGDFANWTKVGDTGYLGFSTLILTGEIDEAIALTDEASDTGFTELFGYIEVTRGSLIFGSYAVSTGPSPDRTVGAFFVGDLVGRCF